MSDQLHRRESSTIALIFQKFLLIVCGRVYSLGILEQFWKSTSFSGGLRLIVGGTWGQKGSAVLPGPLPCTVEEDPCF